MTATLAVVAGLAASSMARRVRQAGRPALIGTLAATAVLAPLPAAAAVIALACWRWLPPTECSDLPFGEDRAA